MQSTICVPANSHCRVETMSRPIALAALTVLELAPPDQVSCAADAGYSHVGLRLLAATPEEVQHAMVGDTPMVRETARRLATSGIRVLDIEIFRLKPDTRRRVDYRPALETGARLGASEALIAGNDPDEARLIDNFAAFCDLAAEFGVGANLEPMPWTDVKYFRAGRARGRTGGAPQRRPADRSDPFRSRRWPRRRDRATCRRRACATCSSATHPPSGRRDTDTLLHQARAERLMPGDGDLDLRGILRAVPRDVPISLEIPMQALARSLPAVERARRMLARTRQLLQTLS